MKTALVLLCCAALLTIAPSAQADERVTITTQNVRVGMTPQHSRHDIGQASENSSIVFTQEMGYRHAQRFAPRGWRSAHFPGVRRGDCATYWDRSVWRLRSSWTKQITFAPFRAGHRFALATVLRSVSRPHVVLAAVCVHMITKSLYRRAVYRRGIARLDVMLDRLRAHHRHVIVGGDWNLPWGVDARERPIGFPHRVLIPQRFRSMPPARATGAKGGRIDYFWQHHMSAVSERVIGHTWSDHNGVRLHLLLR